MEPTPANDMGVLLVVKIEVGEKKEDIEVNNDISFVI